MSFSISNSILSQSLGTQKEDNFASNKLLNNLIVGNEIEEKILRANTMPEALNKKANSVIINKDISYITPETNTKSYRPSSTYNTIQTSDVLFEIGNMRIVLEVKEEDDSIRPLFTNKVAPKRYLKELFNSDRSLRQLKKVRRSLADSSLPPAAILKSEMLDKGKEDLCVKLPSWRETKASLAQVKVPICRAASTPNLLSTSLKGKHESVTNKRLWDYIIKLEEKIIEQQQKLYSMTHEQQMEINMLYNFNNRPKDDTSDLEQLTQEIMAKNTKIQELINIISRESTEESYFSRREEELNVQSIKLEKERERIENSKKDIKAIKATLKCKEELVTSHIEQLKAKTRELAQEESEFKKYKLSIENDIKRDISLIVKNFKLTNTDFEYSNEWIKEAHNKLNVAFNQVSKEVEEKTIELNKINLELEAIKNKYKILNEDHEELLLKYKKIISKVEQLEKNLLVTHKEELNALKEQNQQLLYNLQLVFTKGKSFNPIPKQTIKHSKSNTSLKNVKVEEKELMSEPELSIKDFERKKPKRKKIVKSNKILISSIKSNIESVLEKYRGEELNRSTNEFIKKLDIIISNTEIGETKINEVSDGINENIIKRDQHNMNEQKEYAERIKSLTKEKYELNAIKKQLLKKLNYISALEEGLKMKEEELLDKEQAFIIKEMQLNNNIKAGLDRITIHLSSIKEQKEELLKFEANNVKAMREEQEKLNTLLIEYDFTNDKTKAIVETRFLLETKVNSEVMIDKRAEDIKMYESIMTIISQLLDSINKEDYEILKNNFKKAIREINSLLKLHIKPKELVNITKDKNVTLENVQEQIKKNKSILTESERIGRQIKHLRHRFNNFT